MKKTKDEVGVRGVTLRQWYAGQALSGIIIWDAIKNDPNPPRGNEIEIVVKTAFKIADAMIAHEEKE